MVDVEVFRLRRLRRVALRCRALALMLESRAGFQEASRNAGLLCSSRVLCWRIARIATGRLRAHPYVKYQRGPAGIDSLADGLRAAGRGYLAARLGRPLQAFAIGMQEVARELADARALTWSGDLSDDLGRAQSLARELLRELDLAVAVERGVAVQIAASRAHPAVPAADGSLTARHWPYLAL